MLKRQIQCPQCGAAQHSLEDAVVLMCEYCGSFVEMDTQQLLHGDGLVQAYQKGVQSFIAPSRAQARRTQLNIEMQKAQEAGDRESWRAFAREFYTLLPITDPEMVPVEYRSGGALSRWVTTNTVSGELLAFDEGVQAANQVCVGLIEDLYQGGDVVAKGRALLAAAAVFYKTLMEHPDYPEDGSRPPLDHLAANYVRGIVAGTESILPPGAAATIYEEVLGDKRVYGGDEVTCDGCGAVLDEAQRSEGSCPFCGAAIVLEEDPWLSSLLATWQATVAHLPDDDATAFAALSHPLTSYWTNESVPPAADVYRFLTAAVPWLPAPLLRLQLTRLMEAYESTPELTTMFIELEALLLAWRPSPRPEPEAAPRMPVVAASSAPPAEEVDLADDPWVLQTVAMWGQVRPHLDDEQLEMSLLSQVTTPFYLGGTITAAQALAFFEIAEPGYSLRRMRDALEVQVVAGQQNPDLAEFLGELHGRLGKSN